MSGLRTLAGTAADRLNLPDAVLRAGVSTLVGRTARLLERERPDSASFVRGLDALPIALVPEAANAQHYELPPEFFALVLGKHRKYSCCLYADATTTLDEAEAAALSETCAHAGLADGQDILELGCGWGSLSLWMAEHYPSARITAVSNSRPQRGHIEAEAARRGLANLRVITADMNAFEPDATYDRVVSVEMFEHMANWRALLARVRTWLRPDGRLFLHVFSHAAHPYRFDDSDQGDWIAQHFFTGGMMPSHDLAARFPDLFAVEQSWRWNGEHYARTARDWLALFDAREAEVASVLRGVYGDAWPMWRRRWRIFFLATAGLFRFRGGEVWGVSHHLLRPA
jgi:cyclopropane-fatty-acyl-phospholipid synthase